MSQIAGKTPSTRISLNVTNSNVFFPQEISLSDSPLGPEAGTIGTEDGGTLNAIGRALIQMQQGGQSVAAPGIPQSQLIFTRATSSDSDTTSAQTGNSNGERILTLMSAGD